LRIREYTPADLDTLRRMHAAQGFGYPFPDLNSPIFVSKLVVEEDDNHIEDSDLEEVGQALAKNQGARGREEAGVSSLRDISTAGAPPRGSASRITMAILLRLTAETYLLHDPAAGTPRQRWQRLLALHEAGRRDAAARGLDDVQAFLPPSIARAFGRRLSQLGWTRDPWPCFSRRIP
jgi:hypothetical protein